MFSDNEEVSASIEATPTTSSMGTKTMDPAEFTSLLAIALEEDKIINLLSKAFVWSTDEIIRKIDTIEKGNDVRDDKIVVLQEKVDHFEQKERENNLIIAGLPVENATNQV